MAWQGFGTVGGAQVSQGHPHYPSDWVVPVAM